MFEKDRIYKIEVTSPGGRKLAVAEKDQFSFPRFYIDDMPVTNVIIMKGRRYPELDRDQAVYVITYMKNGDRIRYPAAVRMSLVDQLNVQLRSDFGTLMEERRRFFKVESNIECEVLGYIRDENYIEFNKPMEGVIKNISIGGVYLGCDDVRFSPHDIVNLNFFVEDNPIEIYAEVLRVQRVNGEVDGYGCQFQNVDQNQEEIFGHFVYTIQLQKRIEEQEKEEMREEALLRVKDPETT